MRLKRMGGAVFLDRDGTLNTDSGYTHKIEDWRWMPGALEGLSILKNAGWPIFVISNQSGIGRGYYARRDLHRLEAWLNARLSEMNCAIDGWYYCPHLPDSGCLCRKPKPGLILRAAKEHNLDLAASWMLGDRITDALAGLEAGCKTGLLANTAYREELETAARTMPETKIWKDLAAAAQAITDATRRAGLEARV